MVAGFGGSGVILTFHILVISGAGIHKYSQRCPQVIGIIAGWQRAVSGILVISIPVEEEADSVLVSGGIAAAAQTAMVTVIPTVIGKKHHTFIPGDTQRYKVKCPVNIVAALFNESAQCLMGGKALGITGSQIVIRLLSLVTADAEAVIVAAALGKGAAIVTVAALLIRQDSDASGGKGTYPEADPLPPSVKVTAGIV